MRKRATPKRQTFATYARFSTDTQNPASIDDQERVCDRAIVDLGGTPPPDALRFRDAGISGSATVNRPGLGAMMDAAEQGEFDALVFEDLSRIGRSTAGNAQTIRRLGECGVWLVSATPGINLRPGESTLYADILSAVAQDQLRQIEHRTRRGIEGAIERGRHVGGRVYGYDRSGGSLVINEEQAAVVRRIFAMYLEGDSYIAISKRLNAEGVPAHGDSWRAHSVRWMLRNSRYCGLVVHGRCESIVNADGTRSRRIVPPEERTMREYPSQRIVSEAVFNRAMREADSRAPQTHTDNDRRRRLGGQRNSGHLFSGLLTCAHGHPLSMVDSRSNLYQCSIHRQKRGCDQNRTVSARAVGDHLVEMLRDELTADAIAEARALLRSTQGDQGAELKRQLGTQRAQANAATQRRDNLLARIADAEDPDTIAAMLAAADTQSQRARELTALVAETQARMDRLRGRHAVLPTARQVDEWLRRLGHAATHPAPANVALRRVLCALLPEGIRARHVRGGLALGYQCVPLAGLLALGAIPSPGSGGSQGAGGGSQGGAPGGSRGLPGGIGRSTAPRAGKGALDASNGGSGDVPTMGETMPIVSPIVGRAAEGLRLAGWTRKVRPV